MTRLTQRQLADSRKVFDLCDINGDGLIDRDEFQLLLEALDRVRDSRFSMFLAPSASPQQPRKVSHFRRRILSGSR